MSEEASTSMKKADDESRGRKYKPAGACMVEQMFGLGEGESISSIEKLDELQNHESPKARDG